MASFKHSCETEITVLSHETAFIRSVDLYRSISSALELREFAVGNGEGDFFATDPVAGVIAVAVDEGYFYTLIEDVGEIF